LSSVLSLPPKRRSPGRYLFRVYLFRELIAEKAFTVRGDAATEIIDYVKANQIDLIVAGSRGLSQIKSLWMGSVSRKLVHYSACSVLIVKGPRKE